MGAGIGGIIPVTFHFEKLDWHPESKEDFIKRSPVDFFDFYDEIKKGKGEVYYELKTQALLPHLKSFFLGFHSIISNDELLENVTTFNDDYDTIVENKDRKAFLNHFLDADEYNPRYTESCYFSTVNITCSTGIIFYYGSYKAILEEYRTLYHMEKLLVKAFDNPLAKVAKFGIYG